MGMHVSCYLHQTSIMINAGNLKQTCSSKANFHYQITLVIIMFQNIATCITDQCSGLANNTSSVFSTYHVIWFDTPRMV
jgi:hypothetical protein